MDEGNVYNIPVDLNKDDIQSDPMFQQIESYMICPDLAEYWFQVCQHPAATTLSLNRRLFAEGPSLIFEDQNTSDQSTSDDDEDNDNDDDHDDNND